MAQVSDYHQINFPFASFWQRLLAHNIDLVFLLMVCYPLSLVVKQNLILFPLCFAVYLTFHTAFEMSKWRATPGKKLTQLKVVDMRQPELIWWRVLLRNFLKLISLGILFGGFTMIHFHRRRQGLHDFLTGHIIVHQPKTPDHK
jgi:uncharacterized RDD family membrane protein YckC